MRQDVSNRETGDKVGVGFVSPEGGSAEGVKAQPGGDGKNSGDQERGSCLQAICPSRLAGVFPERRLTPRCCPRWRDRR